MDSVLNVCMYYYMKYVISQCSNTKGLSKMLENGVLVHPSTGLRWISVFKKVTWQDVRCIEMRR